MAVLASDSATLSTITDVASSSRYYLLQSSTLNAPAKPTANPPGGSWADSEPTYTSGSTNSLYFVDLTVFSDGTWAYSPVSLSSSYEAAKVAYNKAVAAVSTANTAKSTADTAKSTADTAKSTADTAKSTANTANTNASNAVSTANKSVSSVVTQYYDSTSATSLTGGSWVETTPTWQEGHYIWSRTKTTSSDGTTVAYSKEVCITGNTGAKGDKGDKGATGAACIDYSQGKMMATDPTFDTSTNHTHVYNNSRNDNVTVTRTAKSSDNPFSNATYELTIANTGNAGPGIGGFYFANQSRANAIFVYRFVAKIPTGYSLAFHTNAIGDGNSQSWRTDTAGTGKFQEYIFYLKCGSSGSFSSTGFFAIYGAQGTTDNPVTWYVAYATYFDMTATSDIKTAQSTADSAVSTANTAKSTADAASTTATNAKSTADSAASTASSAKTTADSAASTANTAKSTAETAKTNAASAVSTANTAKTTADNAATTASNAQTTANTAKNTADSAASTANTAKSTAETAKTNAASAVSTANTAKSTADAASTTANTAKSTADSAASTANTAKSTADAAQSTATTAKSTADSAATAASNAQTTADKAQQEIDNIQTNKLQYLEISGETGTHLKAKGTVNEMVLTNEGLGIYMNGETNPYSKFAANYVQFGKYQLRRTADGGLAFKLEIKK